MEVIKMKILVGVIIGMLTTIIATKVVRTKAKNKLIQKNRQLQKQIHYSQEKEKQLKNMIASMEKIFVYAQKKEN